ncbi:MAG: UDP-N-acetylmuramate dehydrogenase [Chloroflexales bacterium]|nr:UDP-N-acetylmuramate dehydrogenase [Chloroflexales bacterium]
MNLLHIIENEMLAKHTAWRIGGPARYYAKATTIEDLRAGLEWAEQRNLPFFLIGGGTNLLVRDTGFPGLVMHYVNRTWRVTSETLQHETLGATGTLYVEAGAPMAGTVRRIAAQGWAGLEWAEGLPGAVGGAVYGNAGCYGGDIASTLIRAWVLVNDQLEEWPVQQFAYGYRTSLLKRLELENERLHQIETTKSTSQTSKIYRRAPIVLAAEFKLVRADPADLAEKMAAIATERKGKTPWGSSCGSVFKNPPGQSAGRLIEQTGLKGARCGAAEISQRHGNYIVNMGGARSDDVLHLIEMARSAVLRQFEIELELEVRIL